MQSSVVSFRDLDVWQAAMDLAVAAHGLADQLPSVQRFELSSQLRRAATSVPSNIAEGHGRKHDPVFLHHVMIALGSLAELRHKWNLQSDSSYWNEKLSKPCTRRSRAPGSSSTAGVVVFARVWQRTPNARRLRLRTRSLFPRSINREPRTASRGHEKLLLVVTPSASITQWTS
jgi:four helix bundle protein